MGRMLKSDRCSVLRLPFMSFSTSLSFCIFNGKKECKFLLAYLIEILEKFSVKIYIKCLMHNRLTRNNLICSSHIHAVSYLWCSYFFTSTCSPFSKSQQECHLSCKAFAIHQIHVITINKFFIEELWSHLSAESQEIAENKCSTLKCP